MKEKRGQLKAAFRSWSPGNVLVLCSILFICFSAHAFRPVFFSQNTLGGSKSGFSFRRAIVIDRTKVGGSSSSNFPMLFSGTYTYLRTTANGGKVTNANAHDVIFAVDPSCSSKVAGWEIESYSASTGAIVAWVNVASLSPTADTTIYLCYGNSSISTFQSTATNAWSSAFAAVYHMPNGTTLSGTDSTANANSGTVTGTPSGTAGKMGGAGSFTVGTDFIEVPHSTSICVGTQITLSAWVKVNSWNSNGGLIVQKRSRYYASEASERFNYSLWIDGAGKLLFQYARTAGFSTSYDTGTSVSTGAWHHVAAVATDSDQKIRFYLDGVLNSTVDKTLTLSGIGDVHATVQMGAYGTFGPVYSLNGLLDEVRISSANRSADWMTAEYNNQSSPSTFYSVGAEQ